jgi:hypothetical protein
MAKEDHIELRLDISKRRFSICSTLGVTEEKGVSLEEGIIEGLSS